jgi:hypothetical protein
MPFGYDVLDRFEEFYVVLLNLDLDLIGAIT